MKTSLPRAHILNEIRSALQTPVMKPYPFQKSDDSIHQVPCQELSELFAKEFTALEGKLLFCSGKDDLIDKLEMLASEKQWTNVSYQASLPEDLQLTSLPFINNSPEQEPNAGITDCEFLVARTGSIVMTAAQSSGRISPVYAPVHIVIAFRHQIVLDIKDVFDTLKNVRMPSALFFISGPSRTGDIERTLVIGVHGPAEVYVFLLNNS